MQPLKYDEVSVPVGLFLFFTGGLLWMLQFQLHIFNTWMYAILTGFVFIAIGYLFLYADVRVYIGDRTVTEALLTGDDIEDDA